MGLQHLLLPAYRHPGWAAAASGAIFFVFAGRIAETSEQNTTYFMRLPQPLALVALSANMAGVVFPVSSLHLLRINTKYLPPEIRPGRLRRVALVAMAVFYGVFVWLFLLGGFPVDTEQGFLFNFVELMTRME